MDLSSFLTDDQLAVLGCFTALAVCGGVAMLSFQFGPARRQQEQGPSASLRFPAASSANDDEMTPRKAA